MKNAISMDKAGRLVLPKAVRDRFNLSAGSKLGLVTVGDHIELTPVGETSEIELEEKNGLLVIPFSGKPFDAAEAINGERDFSGSKEGGRIRSSRRRHLR